jgi:uncharacterized Ntn-hydrolase superfamily protein
MAKAFEAATGPLADACSRPSTLARQAGGDIRGRQSAAILVVRDKPSAKPWTDGSWTCGSTTTRSPLVELRRLLVLHRATNA